jgi:hypothetical protein
VNQTTRDVENCKAGNPGDQQHGEQHRPDAHKSSSSDCSYDRREMKTRWQTLLLPDEKGAEDRIAIGKKVSQPSARAALPSKRNEVNSCDETQ